jgi:uncharacterized protein
MTEFWTFALVGFLAQLIDGSLGLGFGVISASVLLGQGYAPALVSASVNAAKIPTTATAALSHFIHKNLDRSLVIALAVFGTIGGTIGMLLLTSLKGSTLNYFISFYLVLVGWLIIWRGLRGTSPRILPAAWKRLIGFIGGLIEGIGGSWGPIVTTSLLGSGMPSRYAIGSSNTAEFFVSVTVFSAYMTAFFIGHWEVEGDWKTLALPVAGLVCGGFPAALMGGWLSKVTPGRWLMVAVGTLAIGIAAFRFFSH